MSTPTALKHKGLTEEQALWVIDSMWGSGKRFSTFHDRINNRREHFHNHETKNIKLGLSTDPNNIYRECTSYQTDILRRTYDEVVARLGENPVTCTVTAAADTQVDSNRSDDVSAVFNSWTAQLEEEMGFRIQDRISDGQVRLAGQVMEWGIADNWDSKGTYEAALAGTLAKKRAEQGCPFWVEFPELTACAWSYDRSKKPGPARYVKVMEVALLDYEQAATSAGSTTTTLLTVDMEQQAPGYQVTPNANTTTVSPSEGDDWGRRVTVKCLWTREEYFEFVDGELKKHIEHGYGRIPMEFIPAADTGDPDPVYRWYPYMEGLYVQKPFVDRMMTLTGATTEMGTRPFTYLKQTSPGAATAFEDGSPESDRDQSALGTTLPAGFEYGQIDFANPRDIQQYLAFLVEEMEKSRPSSGQAQIGTGSTAWKFRLEQQQASVAPKALIMKQARGIKAMWNNWLFLLSKPAEDGGVGEDVSAYPWSKDEGRMDRSKVITIPWKELEGYTADANIDPMSAAERTTLTQLLAEFAKEGLILREDFYEAYGKKNPGEYMLRLIAEQLVDPYNQQYAKALVASVLGSQTIMGVDGEIVGMGGQPVAPEQVLAQNGWTQPPPQQPMLPGMAGDGQVGMGTQVAGQSVMSGLGTLQAPGTLPVMGGAMG